MIDLFKDYFSCVKRSITFIFLLFSSLLSFSQKPVSTKELPYQVLFVEDATVFGREVKQFDYLTNNDLLIVGGSVTLFHYSYKMFELDSGSYWMNDLVKGKPRKFNFRPVLDPKGKYKKPISPAPVPLGARYCLPHGPIELLVPRYLYVAKYYWTDTVDLCWVFRNENLYNQKNVFEIQFSNIFDEIVQTIFTNEFSYSFKLDTLDPDPSDEINFEKGFIIVSITDTVNSDILSGDFCLKAFDFGDILLITEGDENYTGIREAIYYDHINNDRRAQILYKYQIKQSNQDPRFIKLYDDFLERNPQFK